MEGAALAWGAGCMGAGITEAGNSREEVYSGGHGDRVLDIWGQSVSQTSRRTYPVSPSSLEHNKGVPRRQEAPGKDSRYNHARDFPERAKPMGEKMRGLGMAS